MTSNSTSQYEEVIGSDNLQCKSHIVIFHCFDFHQRNWDIERALLDYFSKKNFGVLLVINSKNVLESSIKLSQVFSDKKVAWIVRKNVGFDLAGYRDGFRVIQEINKTATILFMNESIVWFPGDFENFLEHNFSLGADISCTTISNQYKKHFQTYFFIAHTQNGKRELSHWLETQRNWRSKAATVHFGEIKTNSLFDKEIDIQSLASLETLTRIMLDQRELPSRFTYQYSLRMKSTLKLMASGYPINPSHSFWYELILCGFPGIKRDLLLRNPIGIEDYDFAWHIIGNQRDISKDEALHYLLSKGKLPIIVRLRNKIG